MSQETLIAALHRVISQERVQDDARSMWNYFKEIMGELKTYGWNRPRLIKGYSDSTGDHLIVELSRWKAPKETYTVEIHPNNIIWEDGDEKLIELFTNFSQLYGIDAIKFRAQLKSIYEAKKVALKSQWYRSLSKDIKDKLSNFKRWLIRL